MFNSNKKSENIENAATFDDTANEEKLMNVIKHSNLTLNELVKLIISNTSQPPAEQTVAHETKAKTDLETFSKGDKLYIEKSAKEEIERSEEDQKICSTCPVMGEKEIANAVEVKAPASENVGLPHAEIAEAIQNVKNTDDVFARQISEKDEFVLGVNRQELCKWATNKRKLIDGTLPDGIELKLLVCAFKTSKTFEANRCGKESHAFKSKRLEEKFGKGKLDEIFVIDKSDDHDLYSYQSDLPEEIIGHLCTRVQQVVRDLHWIQVDLKQMRKRVKRY